MREKRRVRDIQGEINRQPQRDKERDEEIWRTR